MKLLRELNEAVLITEEVGGKKLLHLEGICIQTNIGNRNGRIYPKQHVQGEVARYIKEDIANNRAVGELSHPQSAQINLDRVSHKFVSLKESGDNYVGKCLILDTPMGQIARGLSEGGVQLGISTRALGSVKPNAKGLMEVQNDFKLSTAGDLVANPSAPDAYLNAIMEDKDWVYSNGLWTEAHIDSLKNIVKTKKSQEAILALWEQFLITTATK